MTATAFETTSIPDEPPTISGVDYDPEYPGSTPESPYGFKPDGTPYKRRPKGTSGKVGVKRLPASESSARAAANLLGRMNSLVGFSLMALGMPLTSTALQTANNDFEQLAYESLLTDPALCRKILSAGATSGKAGLVMAYGMLAVTIAPAALSEIKSKRNERMIENEE